MELFKRLAALAALATLLGMSLLFAKGGEPAAASPPLQTFVPFGVALSPGYTQTVPAGRFVTYTHRLTNTGANTDAFLITATSSQGWLAGLRGSALFTGTLGSASLTGTLTLALPLNPGASATLTLRLFVPAAAPNGATDRTTLVVTSQTSPTVRAVATDTTIARRAHALFLPVVLQPTIPEVTLGVDFGPTRTEDAVLQSDYPLVQQMGAGRLRLWLSWAEVETAPGVYNWQAPDRLIQRATAVGLEPLVALYYPPDWAAVEACGPISDTVALENFVEAMVLRYRNDVHAWEFSNEPDGKAPLPSYGPGIGCWGYEPEQYADQLGIFYRKVKSLDPDALVLLGGLAYDNWTLFERSFFDNILQAGAGRYFDVLNLHYYPINLTEFPTMVSKVSELQGIMTRHQLHNKRIWVTETGEWANSEAAENQRNFIAEELPRAFCNGVDSIFWFAVSQDANGSLGGRWLIDNSHQPARGYTTFQTLARKLAGSHCAGAYTAVPNDIEAYRFAAPGREVYILWSNAASQTVTLAATTTVTRTNRDGDRVTTLTPVGGQVTFEVGAQTVFVEVPK
ncbi:MAG: hypothetical protein D6796_04200 [Caldilineae bacterium]|nr:MAG: hypothetical protein D6796_04200 [Caldilineae bacterium]